MSKGLRKPGEFCWINILTPEPAKACTFFGELLGWTFSDMPGMGHFIKVSGHDVGGLFDINSPQTPPGTPPHVGVMVKVKHQRCRHKSDIAGRQGHAAVRRHGQGPHGRLLRSYWREVRRVGAQVPHREPTSIAPCPAHRVGSENLTPDAARSTAFYSDLFGWTPEVMPMPRLRLHGVQARQRVRRRHDADPPAHG